MANPSPPPPPLVSASPSLAWEIRFIASSQETLFLCILGPREAGTLEIWGIWNSRGRRKKISEEEEAPPPKEFFLGEGSSLGNSFGKEEVDSFATVILVPG